MSQLYVIDLVVLIFGWNLKILFLHIAYYDTSYTIGRTKEIPIRKDGKGFIETSRIQGNKLLSSSASFTGNPALLMHM